MNVTNEHRQRLLNMHQTLLTERSTWDTQWRDLSDYILPMRSRFNLSDTNSGSRRNQKIINSTATIANRVLSAGMHAGITSPARPWFRLTVPDPRLAERARVKEWLHATEQALMLVMSRSNFYNGLSLLYVDLGTFGTGTMWIDEDPDDVIRCHVLPVGEYCLMTDHRNVVVGLTRKLRMRVSQIVESFGYRNCSMGVQNLFTKGSLNEGIDVLHVVEPRRERAIEKEDAINMPWASIWMEMAADVDKPTLKVSGYNEFPIMAPRWGVTGNDVYGNTCPGMDSLGDIKALQSLEKRKGQIVDKLSSPPMKASTDLRNQRASLLPGDVTYVPGGQTGVFEPAIVMDPQAIRSVGEEIIRHENRIKEAFMADLWLMMAMSDRREITAREVDERHEEKMLQLGPVLERLQDELLDPCIDRLFGVMDRRGILPPAPPELQGMELKVEYVSILAQAQKLLSTSGVERLATFVLNSGRAESSVMDNFDWDAAVTHYADILGVKPDLVRTPEEVAQIRVQRQALEAEAMQQEKLANEAKATQQLARADTSGQNALTDLMGAAGGPMADAMTGNMNSGTAGA